MLRYPFHLTTAFGGAFPQGEALVRRWCVISTAALLTKDCIASYQASTPNPTGKLIPAQGSAPEQTLSDLTGMHKPSSEWRA